MTKRSRRLAALALILGVLVATPTVSLAKEARSTTTAMWWSILHPGLGEWYLKGWGGFDECPQRKFWLGLIPLYGWPGYLQVKSAIDAKHGRTNDKLTFD